MTAEVIDRVELELFQKQHDFVMAAEPFPAYVGGVGSGKTRGGVVKDLLYLTAHPKALGLLTAPTFPMLRDSTLRTALETFPKGSYEFHKVEMRLEMTNGSELLLRSTDEPEHLRGPNLAFAHMDEAALSHWDAFKIIQGRLRQEGMPHQLWITTTPKGFNWVYLEFAREIRPDYRLITCSARENPYLTPEFLRHLQESYTGEFALQEIEGRFVLVGGQAFFNVKSLEAMLGDCREPAETKQGGLVRVWRKPVVAAKYVGFGDVCWGHAGAYSCFALADWQTGEQVAEIYGRPEHDEYALAITDLTAEYNKAYFGIEANGEGGERSGLNVVNKLIALGLGDRMYHHGEKWRSEEAHRGWLTTGVTRPVMLGELEEAVRLRGIVPRCREAVSEMMSFVRNDKGRPEAATGAYSDHVMAFAGLWQMRKHAKYSIGQHRVGRLAVEDAGQQHMRR